MIGWQELIIILIIVMLIFGTSKISGIGKSLGTAIRDFREAMKPEPPETKKPSDEKPEEAGKPK